MNSPIDQLAKLQSACPSQLSCVASETNERGETEYSHIVQADGVYLNCPTGVRPPLAQFAVWAANNTEAIVAERDGLTEVMGSLRHLLDNLGQQLAERDAEIERLRQCLTKANDQTEEYERKYYLEVNANEDRQERINELQAALCKATGCTLEQAQANDDANGDE